MQIFHKKYKNAYSYISLPIVQPIMCLYIAFKTALSRYSGLNQFIKNRRERNEKKTDSNWPFPVCTFWG